MNALGLGGGENTPHNNFIHVKHGNPIHVGFHTGFLAWGGGGGNSLYINKVRDWGHSSPRIFFLRFGLTIDFSISNINILKLLGGGGGGESQFPIPLLYETLACVIIRTYFYYRGGLKHVHTCTCAEYMHMTYEYSVNTCMYVHHQVTCVHMYVHHNHMCIITCVLMYMSHTCALMYMSHAYTHAITCRCIFIAQATVG